MQLSVGYVLIALNGVKMQLISKEFHNSGVHFRGIVFSELLYTLDLITRV